MVKEITGVPVDVVVTDEHYIDESSDPDGAYSYAYVWVKPDADHDKMITQLQILILQGTNIKAEYHDNLEDMGPTEPYPKRKRMTAPRPHQTSV